MCTGICHKTFFRMIKIAKIADWEKIPRLDGSETESLGMKPLRQHEKHSIICWDHCAIMAANLASKMEQYYPTFSRTFCVHNLWV